VSRSEIEHVPVLSEVLMSLVDPRPGETVVDATVGHGGHAELLAGAIGSGGRFIGLDIDESNLARARSRVEKAMAGKSSPSLHWVRANFSELGSVLDELGVSRVDVILADLGVSTDQLLDSSRGFTFSEDGPLDMRIDQRLETTAADVVNRLEENELADLIFHSSQERFSRRIAKRICEARREKRIRTVSELVGIVCSAMGVSGSFSRHRIHPATRTFLALRMAVNHELEHLQELLEYAPRRLSVGGRLAVISFHSGEDRIVKQNFLDRKRDGVYEIRTKKPVQASSEETLRNPRARSAKLRVALRLASAQGSA